MTQVSSLTPRSAQQRMLVTLGCALAMASLEGQSPQTVATAVALAARDRPDLSLSTPIEAGGRTGHLALAIARDTSSGRCRSFSISYGAAGGYAGEVCFDPTASQWNVRSIHATPSAASASVIAMHGLTPRGVTKALPPVLLPGPRHIAGEASSYGLTVPAFHIPAGTTGAPSPAPAPLPGPVPQPASPDAAQLAPVEPDAAASSALPVTPGPSVPVSGDITVGALSQAVAKNTEQMPIRYNRPTQIAFEHTTPVSLIVETASVQKAVADLKIFPGEAKSATAALSSVVTARLIGDPSAVIITARMSETQEITNLANVSWIWDVRAIKPGPTSLTLQVIDLLPVGGVVKAIPVVTYTDQINVSVDPIAWMLYEINRIDPIYKFLGLGTPAALVIGVVAWWRSRRKRDG